MEKLLKYIPFHFLCCLIIGILLQFYCNVWQFGFQKLAILFFTILFVLGFLHKFKMKIFFSIISLIFFVFVGVSSVYIKDARNYTNYYNYLDAGNSAVILTIDEVLKSGNYYDKYKAEVSQVNDKKTIGKVLLNIHKDSLQNVLKIDDKIFLKPVFKDLISPLNPYQFSYKEYLVKQGIYHQIFIRKHQYSVVGKRDFSILGLAFKFREKIQKSLKKYNFTKDEFAVINALLLGQRQEISKELLQDYTRAGAIHILAVSGLHVGIILLLLSQLFKGLEVFKNGIIIKTILIVLLLWMFAFIAGLSASVVRAVTMFTFVAVGQSFKRKRIIEHSLITSMFFLLLIKPMFLFDVGFQLSYLAVFGIVWTQPLLYNLWQPKFILLDKGWQILSVSLAAQVGILPVSLYYFHQFPGLFMLSNLIIIPFLGIILLSGIVIIILSLITILPQFLADLYGVVIDLMNNFVSWISHQEQFLFKEISISFEMMILWYFVIFFGFLFFIKKTSKSLIFVLFSLFFVQIMYFYEGFQKNKKEEFIVFHKSRKSVLGVRKGAEFTVFTDVDSSKIQNEKLLVSYRVGEHIDLKYTNTIPNIFQFKNKTILRIDSLGIYKLEQLKNPIVLLQYSPKINLKRLIKGLNPTQIIVDGTNYKSYINRWKETCVKEKTPFFYTGKNGAYILKK